MNVNKFKAPSPWKSKSPSSHIRSAAFRKKYQDGMPRINHKAIPFHNLYDVEISNMEIAKEHGLKFWGCILPQRKKYKTSTSSCSNERKMTQTRGQTIFKKYMKRRPSLSLTPRSYQVQSSELNPQGGKKYQTITQFSPQRKKLHNYSLTLKLHPQQQHKLPQSIMITNQQISAINKKSVYDMTPLQLQISIEWKKRFLKVFEKKIKEVKKLENSVAKI